MTKKPKSEQETREGMLRAASQLGCKMELLQIFAYYDEKLRGCTNKIEAELIAIEGIQTIERLLTSTPENMMINGKEVKL